MDFTIAKQEDRENFIPELVSMDMRMLMNFENAIYIMMDRLNPEYSGGSWDFITMPNGAKAMVLISDDVVNVPPQPNYFEGDINEFALTYALNMYVCSHFSFGEGKGAESVGENFHKLSEAIPEDYQWAGKIFALLD